MFQLAQGSRDSIVNRSHLFQTQDWQSTHIVLITAPSGYGKTVLAHQLVSYLQYPVVWQSLNIWQRDWKVLHATSVELWSPTLKLEHRTIEIQSDVSKSVHTICQSIYAFKSPVVYVLDDVHLLADSPLASDWLQEFINQLPSNCYLVLSGRRLPTLQLLIPFTRGQIIGFGIESLRFSKDDTQVLASQTIGQKSLTIPMMQLINKLEGWISGIRLALNPVPSRVAQETLKVKNADGLFQQLAEAIIAEQKLAIRQFLWESSCLDFFTLDTLIELLGDDSRLYLSLVQNQNLFLTLESNRYHYHTLFRDVLQQQFKKEYPSQYQSLHRKIGNWYQQQDEIQDAFTHYVEANEIELVVEIVNKNVFPYQTEEKWQSLLHFQAVLVEHDIIIPNLNTACAAICIEQHNFLKADTLLEQAQTVYREKNDKLGEIKALIQTAHNWHIQGHYAKSLELLNQVLQRDDVPENLRAWALRTQGLCFSGIGDYERALATFKEALPGYEATGDIYSISYLLQDLSIAYLQSGELRHAEETIQSLMTMRRELGQPNGIAHGLNLLGYFYHYRSEYDLAVQTYKSGLDALKNTANPRIEGVIYWGLGDIARDRGHYQKALDYYHQAEKLITTKEIEVYCRLMLSIARLHAWQSHFDKALSVLKTIMEMTEKSVFGLFYSVALTLHTMYSLLNQNHKQKLDGLPAHVENLENQYNARYLMQILGSYMLIGLSHNRISMLDEAILIARRNAPNPDLLQPLVAEIANIPVLKTYFIENRSQYKDIVEGIEKIKPENLEIHDNIISVNFQKAVQLRLFTLGRCEVHLNSRRLTKTDWQAQAARELFFYLYFNGPKSREVISSVFWGEKSASQVRSMFHTTVHRVRAVLGEQTLRYENDLYFIDSDISITCDACTMEEYVTKAQLLAPRTARADDLFGKAAKLYRGDFLDGSDMQWVIPARETYRQYYVAALLGCGHCAQAQLKFEAAIGWYERARQEEPYDERSYQEIMRCYQAVGRKQDIQRCYSNLVQLFQSDLSSPPSEATKALYQQLMQQ
jgi:ATP/maltotriose-dependent transcriptional regulator MalT/DNA-binding SARP family transcriptional activator